MSTCLWINSACWVIFCGVNYPQTFILTSFKNIFLVSDRVRVHVYIRNNFKQFWGWGLAPLNRFKPSSKIFYWPFQGGTSFVDLLWFCSVLCLLCLCASVYMCFVVTCWERADLLALVCGVFCEFVTFPLVSWVRCGTWLYRFLIFAPLLTLKPYQNFGPDLSPDCLLIVISGVTTSGDSWSKRPTISKQPLVFYHVARVVSVAMTRENIHYIWKIVKLQIHDR